MVQVKWKGVLKIGAFRPMPRFISETIQDGHSYNGGRICNHSYV